jgi:hypothetical protein
MLNWAPCQAVFIRHRNIFSEMLCFATARLSFAERCPVLYIHSNSLDRKMFLEHTTTSDIAFI